MTDTAKTGGMKEFSYPKGYKPARDESLENDIDEAYVMADERKKRQKRNMIAIGTLIALVAIITLFGFLTN
jgi:hypothetical protein